MNNYLVDKIKINYPAANFQGTLREFIIKIISQKEIIKKFEDAVKLDFVEEKVDGNVCFATNNDEMQDDFKLIFLPIDLLNFFIGKLHSQLKSDILNHPIEISEIPYPADKDDFWEHVNIPKARLAINNMHLYE